MALSLGDFARNLAAMSGVTRLMEHEILELQCQAIEDEAKSYIGHYDHPGNWPQLAESTQQQRISLGFAANEPLLRTGDLRDSIQHTVSGGVGYVFSNSPIARYQELGTEHIPPRPFLSTASIAVSGKLVDIAGQTAVSLLASAIFHGPGRFLRGLIRGAAALPNGAGITHRVEP
jgi:HK97 gp10 family phage protein